MKRKNGGIFYAGGRFIMKPGAPLVRVSASCVMKIVGSFFFVHLVNRDYDLHSYRPILHGYSSNRHANEKQFHR